MKTLFRVTAALTLGLGLGWLFAPQAILTSFGVQGDGPAIYMSRRYGALFFGYAVLLWLARDVEASRARSAILAGGMVVSTVIAVVSLLGVLSGVVGPVVWSAFVVEALLALSFGYYFFKGQ